MVMHEGSDGDDLAVASTEVPPPFLSTPWSLALWCEELGAYGCVGGMAVVKWWLMHVFVGSKWCIANIFNLWLVEDTSIHGLIYVFLYLIRMLFDLSPLVVQSSMKYIHEVQITLDFAPIFQYTS